MKKNFAILCAAASAAAMAAPASAAVTVTCNTNTGPGSSSCDTLGPGSVGRSQWTATSNPVAVKNQNPDFWLRTTSAVNPLAMIDFTGNLFTMQVLGLRQISQTQLTFTSSKAFKSIISTSGFLSNKASVNSKGQLVIDLRGVTLRPDNIGTPLNEGLGTVQFSAVPEPGTWMLMILGLGAVGFAMRRRHSTSVNLQFA